MNITDKQLNRIKSDFENYAGETIEIKNISNALYAFGSELATLRILKKYQHAQNVTQGYSEPYKTHYFCLDLNKPAYTPKV